jgi:hypothetical protein
VGFREVRRSSRGRMGVEDARLCLGEQRTAAALKTSDDSLWLERSSTRARGKGGERDEVRLTWAQPQGV